MAAGQWIPVGGMWVEADMNLPSGERLARQIVHGQRYFESRFGRRCTEMWIPDVFGYPASMPQLYAAGGMRRSSPGSCRGTRRTGSRITPSGGKVSTARACSPTSRPSTRTAIDAVKPADDETLDVIVRFHEALGDRTTVNIRCDRPVVAASRCNLLEEPIADVEVSDGAAMLTLQPFQIVTLRLSRSGLPVGPGE